MHLIHVLAGAEVCPQTRFLTSFRPLALLLAGALSLPEGAAAQAAPPPRFHVSLSSTTTVGTTVFDDTALLTAGAGLSPFPFFVEGHWQGTTGLVPGDIDAFTRRPDMVAGSAGSMLVSTLSNEGSFLDGDVLGFRAGGGLEVIVAEGDITAALGVPAANIDIDALAFDDQGALLFSLQDDLPGTIYGTVLDGDILKREPQGLEAIVYTEADVQAFFTAATGSASAIGDVSGLEFSGGEIWFSVLSPSAYDGAVIALGPQTRVIVDEASMGLGGAELDALALSDRGDEIPTFTMLPGSALPGDSVAIEAHGDPNAILVVLMAGTTGWLSFASRPGFGAWYLDPNDPWLITVLRMSTTYVKLDAQGTYRTSWNLPTGNVYGPGFVGELGWSFQIIEVPTLELSAPYRVKKL